MVFLPFCFRNIVFALTLTLTLFSCDGIKNKSHEAVDKTKETISDAKQELSERKNHLIDKVFPTYDNGKADTENNKKRFKEHLQVDITADVKNIYAYGDFLGADYKVLIAFTCDQATIDKITVVKKMQLSAREHDSGLLFLNEFSWWNKNKLELIAPYKTGKPGEYWQYLWYDSKNHEAFYEEYSL